MILGIPLHVSSLSEKIISGLGGFISIFAVYLITSIFVTAQVLLQTDNDAQEGFPVRERDSKLGQTI
jgi:hypothetical protein